MLTPIQLMLAAYHSLRLAVQPGHLPSIFGLVSAMNSTSQLAAMREHLAGHPRAAAALEKPFHLAIDVVALGELPVGSLGRAFADFAKREGIEPAVLTDQALGERDWIPMHLYEVHDIWHVVTGIGTDVVSEVQILAFMLAQLPRTRMAPMAISVALMRGALGHRALRPDAVLMAIQRGSELGRTADLIFGVNWSHHWHRPLRDVQVELGLVAPALGGDAVPDGPALAEMTSQA